MNKWTNEWQEAEVIHSIIFSAGTKADVLFTPEMSILERQTSNKNIHII